ncbi:hypothetical protein [Streptomyces sp. SID13031]|uniref:hypothetical protein n=1 Tax=Streptomyces sp. SID13031 TaxID=2706046 RepID=UPI0013CC0519|nr:hypothetical protein [Streptomyces sp. SID13031]NEA33837.1 hypothetical protein [Streptomyces sp. SID13031]
MTTFRTPGHWLTWLIAALVTSLVGITIGIANGTAAFAADNVSGVTFAGSTLVGKAPASWTVGFTTSNGNGALAAGGTITAKFDSAFTVTGGLSVALSSAFGGCSATTASGSSSGAVTIVLAGAPCGLAKSTSATLTIAGIINPTPGPYANTTFSVATSSDAPAISPSAGVTIVASTATKLAFTQQPVGASPGIAFTTQPKVTVQDAFGNTVTTDSSVVTLSITSGTPSTGGPGVFTCGTPTRSAGVTTFSGCQISTSGIAYKLHAVDGTLAAADSAAFDVTGLASELVYVQGPSSVAAGAAISPAITVQLQDSIGNAVATSGVSVTLAVSAGVIDGGASATTDGAGRATFSSVVINTAAVGLTMTASASGLTAAPASAAFNVTVAVSNGAALTDTVNDGSGSGVKTVSYYYCAGYIGSCTSANWTPIGSSITAAGNYPVTWSGQPTTNGAYRLVVVGTDNVNNISQASASIPVTVTN